MFEKVPPIRNPLTIIAMFAGLAEISGTYILPHIADSHQGLFIWFLMVFPICLIVMFFLTLNFNHKVLYAPSDFRDEENFFKSLRPASAAALIMKLKDDVQQADDKPDSTQPNPLSASQRKDVRSDFRARIRWAEDLALYKLAKELGGDLQRDVSIGPDGGRDFLFDGIIRGAGGLTGVEVIYLRTPAIEANSFRAKIQRIIVAQQKSPDAIRGRFSLVIAIVLESTSHASENLRERAYSAIGATPTPVTVRVFVLSELEAELLGD